MRINYIINERGIRKAAVISIKDWENIQKKLKIAASKTEKSKDNLLTEMKKSIEDVKLIKSGKKKPKNINQLLKQL